MPRTKLWINPTHAARHLGQQTGNERRNQVYLLLDGKGFDWQVFLVAASGFFTDSYNLFATNVILPSLAFVYWSSQSQNDPNLGRETAINAVTLGGSAVGQLLFGYLADRYGRRKLYGLELIIVIVSTLGLTQASTGYSSMDILGWLLFYRLMQGVGIGAEYPLSAVITAEFASARARPRMMAAVFLMQPLGQLLAAVVGLGVVSGYATTELRDSSKQDAETTKQTIDVLWRWVIGVGAIPAFLAILFRLTIPESPRFTLDVEEDSKRALEDTMLHQGSRDSVLVQEMGDVSAYQPRNTGTRVAPDNMSLQSDLDGTTVEPIELCDEVETSALKRHFWKDFGTYLSQPIHWKRLLGVSMCWFLLDFAFYGLGINNPRTLAKIWASDRGDISCSFTYAWATEVSLAGDCNIYYVLRQNAIRSIITTSIGSLLGSIILIKVINYIPRKSALHWTFVALFVLLLVTGATFFKVFDTDLHALTIVLYVLCQLIFNLGPNTLIFIIAAEIFPTRFRGTCYGIAAASGKLSSVIVTCFLPYVHFGKTDKVDPDSQGNPDASGLGYILIIFSFVMLLGAAFSWWLIPDVQIPRAEGSGYQIPSKTLEELASDGDAK